MDQRKVKPKALRGCSLIFMLQVIRHIFIEPLPCARTDITPGLSRSSRLSSTAGGRLTELGRIHC